jgi:hypothetical protein
MHFEITVRSHATLHLLMQSKEAAVFEYIINETISRSKLGDQSDDDADLFYIPFLGRSLTKKVIRETLKA